MPGRARARRRDDQLLPQVLGARRRRAGRVPNTTISLTFSEPVDLKKAAPVLSPKIGGTWVQSSPTTLAYHLDSPFVPSTQETVTLPGGTSGMRAANGTALSGHASITFDLAAGDMLRVQELLAGLGYLPLDLHPDRSGARRRRTWPWTSRVPSPGAGPTSRPS